MDYKHSFSMLVDDEIGVLFGVTSNGWIDVRVDGEEVMTLSPSEAERIARNLIDLSALAAAIRAGH